MADKIKKLKELKKLYDEGLINQQEYDDIKFEIINQGDIISAVKAPKESIVQSKIAVTDKVPAKKTAPQKNTQITIERNNTSTKKSSRWLLKTLLIGAPILIIGMVIWEDQFAYGGKSRYELDDYQDDSDNEKEEYDYEEVNEDGYEEEKEKDVVNSNKKMVTETTVSDDCTISDVSSSYLGIAVKVNGERRVNCYLDAGEELVGYGKDFLVTRGNHNYVTSDCNCKTIAFFNEGVQVTSVIGDYIYVNYNGLDFRYNKNWKSR